jgi:hypothetical protein
MCINANEEHKPSSTREEHESNSAQKKNKNTTQTKSMDSRKNAHEEYGCNKSMIREHEPNKSTNEKHIHNKHEGKTCNNKNKKMPST